MSSFFDTLLQLDDILAGNAILSSHLKLCQLELEKNSLPQIPQDYIDFLSVANGLYYNGALLYGVSPDLKVIKDILSANKKPSSNLILGENDSDWLIFDSKESEFQIRDKTDASLWKHSASLFDVLPYLLQI